jgi:hypothetical protein
MIVPTTNNLKAKFPEFADESDASVEFAIEEAQLNVDDTWIDTLNSTLGLYYLSAHYLMVSRSRAESASGQMVRSENFGPMSVTYATPNQPTAASSSDLTTTPYGTRFLELVHLNFPPVAVV